MISGRSLCDHRSSCLHAAAWGSFETPVARVTAATILLAALIGCGGSAVTVGSTVPAILFSPIARPTLSTY